MIINNRDALEYIKQQKQKPFSHKMIHESHRILVKNTHKEKPITVGMYRKGSVYVVNAQGKVIYEGPPAAKIKGMMDQYIQWVNEENGVHSLIKAAIVYLYFVHVHPFDDGNGRSARALSNLYLMKKQYQFINFLSPSDYFDHHKASYYRAIHNAEIHGNDMTFFVLYYLKALARQLKDVHNEIQKERVVGDIHELLKIKKDVEFNKKQIKAIRWMISSSEKITTKKYCKLCKCSDETARKDFNRLIDAGIVKRTGEGRNTGYILKKK